MKSQLVRMLVSVMGGIAVFWIVNVSAWYYLRDARYVCIRQWDSRFLLRLIANAIDAHVKETGVAPDSLIDVPALPRTKCRDPDGLPTDAWGHELRYEVSPDGKYSLYSLGRDGRRGGVGLDGDLYHDGRGHDQSLATFNQFLTSDPGEVDRFRFVFWASVTAVCFGVIVFMANHDRSSPNRLARVLGRVVIVTATILVACMVGTLFILFSTPSGH